MEQVDVVIVGAGLSGINAAHRIQTQVSNYSYIILESRESIGGTWGFFKYPGLRSDSDVFTFGFPFKPWTKDQSIADGDSILQYIKDTAHEFGIDSHIRFKHKLNKASFSSSSARWTLDVTDSSSSNPTQKQIKAKFIFSCTGYYNYDEALASVIPGIDHFKGTVVHPQFWPEDLNYENKKIVIIGSGATAITLLPNLSEKASQVTMLQRSPSYIVGLPAVDKATMLIRSILPAHTAHSVIRFKNALVSYLFVTYCKYFPERAKNLIIKETEKLLPENIPVSPHFTPSYYPWEQRLCLCPDGDFFAALRSGKGNIATGKIRDFTENSVQLENGDELEADIVVTATGLKILLLGGVQLEIDGKKVEINQKHVWKGSMLQDIPNFFFCIGYTNASWTLGSDIASRFATRIIREMLQKNQDKVVPVIEDEKDFISTPLLNWNSTYIQSAKDSFPK